MVAAEESSAYSLHVLSKVVTAADDGDGDDGDGDGVTCVVYLYIINKSIKYGLVSIVIISILQPRPGQVWAW